jgi:uncharacterized protein YlxW (UPF0749 family)
VTRPPGRTTALLVPLTALLAGLLFATSAETAQGTDLRGGRRLQLTDLIAQERAQVDRQEATAAALRRDVAAGTEQASARNEQVAQARAQADALELAAGLEPVVGPALTVSLDDAPRTSFSENPDDLVVHQQDVQAVVNALWAGGAEAMTLMGQRVISTSAVRCVGNTVVLHGQVYGPPFVVTAIGDQDRMRTALDLEPGVELFQRYVERFGLGYAVTAQDEVRLPAYEGPLQLPSVVPLG